MTRVATVPKPAQRAGLKMGGQRKANHPEDVATEANMKHEDIVAKVKAIEDEDDEQG